MTGLSRLVVAETSDEKRQPAIMIKNAKGSKRYLLPSRAHLMVQNGDEVFPGDVLAKIPRETTRTKDITGGLPRVAELFEARKPRETAIISEIDGAVRFGEVSKGQRKIYVTADSGEEKEYSMPRGVHVNVQEGERMRAGDPLMDGPLNPHDILAVLGEKELQSYMVTEIQEVYRLQGVAISDKHIEVIVRQMLRWVKVEDPGDTAFLVEQQVDKFRFREENERVINNGGRPAVGRPLLLGITKASLSTDSRISAASFQETTRVLTEAAINGAVDQLRGLKENVIVGRLIPAGTGIDTTATSGCAGTGRRCCPRAAGSFRGHRSCRTRTGTDASGRRSRRNGCRVTICNSHCSKWKGMRDAHALFFFPSASFGTRGHQIFVGQPTYGIILRGAGILTIEAWTWRDSA